jgi:hypothetical protein
LKDTLSLAAVIALLSLLVWALASRWSGYLIQTRLYLASAAAFAILAGAGFDSLDRSAISTIRLGNVVGILVLLVLGLNCFQLASASAKDGSLAYLSGNRSREEYLYENLGWYYEAARTAADIPGDSPVLMLWEPRSFYCAPTCKPDEVIDRWMMDFRHIGRPEGVRDAWLAEGFTHLLLHKSGVDFVKQDDLRYTDEDWNALDVLLSDLTLVRDFGGAYSLYELSP